jgi:hypothetical protein
MNDVDIAEDLTEANSRLPINLSGRTMPLDVTVRTDR